MLCLRSLASISSRTTSGSESGGGPNHDEDSRSASFHEEKPPKNRQNIPSYPYVVQNKESELQSLPEIGIVSKSSKNSRGSILDWALVEIKDMTLRTDNRVEVASKRVKRTLIPQKVAKIPAGNTEVLISSGTKGVFQGVLSGEPSLVKMPQDETFQCIFEVTCDGVLCKCSPIWVLIILCPNWIPAYGDCRSWILNAKTGDLLAILVAGFPGSGLGYTLPADRIFEDMNETMASVAVLATGNLQYPALQSYHVGQLPLSPIPIQPPARETTDSTLPEFALTKMVDSNRILPQNSRSFRSDNPSKRRSIQEFESSDFATLRFEDSEEKFQKYVELIDLQGNQYTVLALFDTGASSNFVSRGILSQIGSHKEYDIPQEYRAIFRSPIAADTHRAPTRCIFVKLWNKKLGFYDHNVKLEIIEVPEMFEIIIGRNLMARHSKKPSLLTRLEQSESGAIEKDASPPINAPLFKRRRFKGMRLPFLCGLCSTSNPRGAEQQIIDDARDEESRRQTRVVPVPNLS